MLNKKEKSNQFKSDLRSIKRWRKEIEEINYELIKVANDLLGVSSPVIKQIYVREGSRSNTSSHKLILMDQEQRLINERKRLRGNIDVTLLRLERVKNERDKQMIEELYLNHRKKDEYVANQYGYSKQGMYKKIENIINDIY